MGDKINDSLARSARLVRRRSFLEKRLVHRGFRFNIRPVSDAIYDEDLVASATALNAAVADVIMIDPAQYMWNYKRFRRKPDGRRRYRKSSL